MSAGSDASNFGYGNIFPNSNVNGNYVNLTSSNNPIHFGSNEIPGLPGLSGAKNNVDAARGYVPGICMNGGQKIKKKIKNITKRYRMKNNKKKTLLRKRIKSFGKKKNTKYKNKRNQKTRKTRKTRKNIKGGYSQYQNNQPITPSFSVGTHLNANQSMLASPPPIQMLSNNTNCIDNYNHFTGLGFPSCGH
jgi:hypothetical protein